MMTLKLDMKHICKKEVWGGGSCGRGVWEAGGELCMDTGRQGAQSFSGEGIQM